MNPAAVNWPPDLAEFRLRNGINWSARTRPSWRRMSRDRIVAGGCPPGRLDGPGPLWRGPEAHRVRLSEPVQGAAVDLEPFLGLVGAGADPVDVAPEAGGVVELAQVSDLVGGQVIQHEGRRHDEPPGEVERSLGRAGAPAALGVAHR